jgi:hypothetical protein
VDSNHRSTPCQGVILPLDHGTESVPRAGVEPAPVRSKRTMISVSPSGPKRKARDLNPHPLAGNRRSRSARPTVSGYLPLQWTHRELNPDFQHAMLASCLWTMSPQWTAGDSNPDSRHAKPVSCRWTSSPSVIPDGLEPSLPGCGPGVFAAGPRDHGSSRGGSRTHKITGSRPGRFASLRTRPQAVAGLGVAPSTPEL